MSKIEKYLPSSFILRAARRDPHEVQPLGRLVCRQSAASGETSILLRLLFSVLTHIHSSPPARQNPVASPTSLPPRLPSLYWAHEGEPVPSGATVQIAVLPPQMDASLLRTPRESGSAAFIHLLFGCCGVKSQCLSTVVLDRGHTRQ